MDADEIMRARLDRTRHYLRIEQWAKRRYQRDGRLTTWVGNGVAGRPRAEGYHAVPSRYSMIEDLAAAKYLRVKRRWPSETLATAYADRAGA